ncbi:LemA family protein [candidate division LCP-89 bacterium B3_LCP]|uniref:LemA family protein n=1 Tax=candidate division LCP-89 bacterium B3_LCP TaxID=2012998 RepID=A0A532V0W0_UNCL8|nr:MAG: LemA family protein [candidate division LCP-89 bacterium B3_LCP]
MKRGTIILLVVLGVIIIGAFSIYGFVKSSYNGLVAADEGVNGAWAQVENQLQRRFDLIPNLVKTVKGYAEHEMEVFTRVTEARAKVGGAGSIGEKMGAENNLSSALSRLLLVVENYPQLKADQNFIRLQDELAGTENRIAVERRRYNQSVQIFNVMIRTFPRNIIANMFGFERAEFFEAPEAAQEAPQVEF